MTGECANWSAPEYRLEIEFVLMFWHRIHGGDFMPLSALRQRVPRRPRSFR